MSLEEKKPIVIETETERVKVKKKSDNTILTL